MKFLPLAFLLLAQSIKCIELVKMELKYGTGHSLIPGFSRWVASAQDRVFLFKRSYPSFSLQIYDENQHQQLATVGLPNFVSNVLQFALKTGQIGTISRLVNGGFEIKMFDRGRQMNTDIICHQLKPSPNGRNNGEKTKIWTCESVFPLTSSLPNSNNNDLHNYFAFTIQKRGSKHYTITTRSQYKEAALIMFWLIKEPVKFQFIRSPLQQFAKWPVESFKRIRSSFDH